MPGRLRKLSSSGGGGYVVSLGNTMENARHTLEYLDYYNWIDGRTRMIFVEFALYGADINVFHIVALIFEVNAIGQYIPSYKIQTNQIFPNNNSRFMTHLAGLILLSVMTFFYATREAGRLRKIQWEIYFTEGWTVIDFMLVICGVSYMGINITRQVYVGSLFHDINESNSTDYIGLGFLGYICRLEDYILAFLSFIITVKCFRLLTVKRMIWEWERVIRHGGRMVIAIIFVISYVLLVASSHLLLVMGRQDEDFSNYSRAMAMHLAHMVQRTHDNRPLMHDTPVFGAPVYVSALIYIHLALVHSIEMVLAVHHKVVSLQPHISYYHITKFIRSQFNSNVKVPAPPTTPVPQPVTLRQMVEDQYRTPRYVDEGRLQGLKRVTLGLLQKSDPIEATALNMIYLSVTENIERPGTDTYNTVVEHGKNVLVSSRKVIEMRDIATKIVDMRNDVVKNELKVGNELMMKITKLQQEEKE